MPADPWRVLVTGGSGFIGTHVVERLRQRPDTEVLNLDVRPPHEAAHLDGWRFGDVTETDAVARVFAELEPTHVVHLAAETTTAPGVPLSRYRTNLRGTAVVLDAVAGSGAVDRVVVTSTQFVCRPGHLPTSDTDYAPHTVYGHSKVVTETQTRAAQLGGACRTIIRPTTIWGPWDLGYRAAFHRLMRRGWYVHPDVGPCLRSYGYVGNVAWQVERILELPRDRVDRQVLYLGDREIDVRDFAEEFSRQLHGRPVRLVPQALAHTLARVGDALSRARIPFPIHGSRYASLTTSYPVPIERTFELLGDPPFGLSEGVERTIAWLRQRVWVD